MRRFHPGDETDPCEHDESEKHLEGLDAAAGEKRFGESGE